MTRTGLPTALKGIWSMPRHLLTRWIHAPLGRVLALALAVTLPAAAVQAHSFSLAVLAGGEHAAAQLDSAVKGILLATQERDGHANETSDGHLGGLDVYIVPLPAFAAETIQGLKGVSQASIDVAILLDPEAELEQAMAGLDPQTVIMRPGTINPEPTEASKMFAMRYQTAYGTVPDQSAVAGYNAARRVDLAVRPLGGVDDRPALEAALAASKGGIEW